MSRPNLVLVLADQFRASSLGCLDQDPTSTPALDRLALEGRLCTDAVSSYPVCSPARAMLLTGQYPWSNGVPFNVNSETAPWGVGLRVDARCWSDVLADQGYQLGYIGKWHLTPPTPEDEVHGEGRREDGKVWDAWTPPTERHGFSFWYSHGCCDQHLEPHYWTTEATRDHPERVRQWSAERETDVAIEFLRWAGTDRGEDAGRARPFALVVSFNPPHQPFEEVPESYLPRYADMRPDELLRRPNVDVESQIGAEAARIARKYYAAVTAVDDQVGRLLDELDRLQLAADTVVLFTSDHGMQLGSHELMYKSVPYEESMRVPFIVRWPGHVRPGRDDLLIGLVDVAPTVLGLLGLAAETPEDVHGADCSGALLGRPAAPRPDAALYLGPGRHPADPDVRGLRTRTHKLVVEYREESGLHTRLVDLSTDPFELRDVASEQPTVVAAMLTRLAGLLAESHDPWPGLALVPAA